MQQIGVGGKGARLLGTGLTLGPWGCAGSMSLTFTGECTDARHHFCGPAIVSGRPFWILSV